MKVLIAEDDDNIRNGLIEALEAEGYVALGARDGRQAIDLFTSQAPDFVCLDIMMPRLSGYDVCRQIRQRNPDIPIIFITAKSEEIDKILGLELGGDDYILKPFGVREVLARIRAIARRCLRARRLAQGADADNQPFRIDDLEVIPDELRAHRGDETIDLSLRDINLLRLFHAHRGRALDRHTIFAEIWGVDHIPNSRTLDQHIAQLRKRIERDPRRPEIIQTVHGVGYRIAL